MVKAKKYSEADLANFYLVSPVFKKYSKLRLWSYNFSEYTNIIYCEIYLSKYFLGRTEKYILEYFSEYFLLTLQNSPKFLKFLESGFFKYINYHFLLLFQNNCLFFFEDFYEDVEFFVEEYFRIYIQDFFERDLLLCLITCIRKRVPISFDGYLSNRLKLISKGLLLIELNTKSLVNSVEIRNFIGGDRNNYCYLGFVSNTNKKLPLYKVKDSTAVKRKYSYSLLIAPNSKIYKSVNIVKDISGAIKSKYLLSFLGGTIFNLGYLAISTHNKASTEYYNVYYNIYPTLSFRYNGRFYTFVKCIYKLSEEVLFTPRIDGSSSFNYDFQGLLGSLQILVNFNKEKNDIGIYRENISLFNKNLNPIYFKLGGIINVSFLNRFEHDLNKLFIDVNLGGAIRKSFLLTKNVSKGGGVLM